MGKDTPFPPGARLAAYFRDSGGKEQDLSVPQQEAYARQWCEEHGYILVRPFADIARPGKTTVGRAEFEKLIQYLRGGGEGESGVILWKWSRFARDIDDSQYFRADIRRRGFTLHSLQDNIPTGPEGRLIESAIDYMNQRYLVDLASDVARGQKFIAAVYHGYPLGKVPVGLRRVPFEIGKRRDGKPHIVSRLEPDPERAPLVVKAYELRAAGSTYREIDSQVRLFTSKPSYSKILRHTLYIGRFTYQDLVIDDFCPAIIPLPLWQAVQRINQDWENKRNHPRRQTSRFLLSGLLVCGVCGHPMTGKTTHAPQWPTSRFDYYRCTQSSELIKCPARMIPKAAIEERAIERLAEYVQRPDILEAVYRETVELAQSMSAQVDPALSHARADLARLDIEIRNILAAIKDAGHSVVLLNELSALEKRQGELRALAASLDAKRQNIRLDITLEQVIGIGTELAARLKTADERGQQQLLRGFVRRIVAERVDGESGLGTTSTLSKITGEIEFYILDQVIRLPL